MKYYYKIYMENFDEIIDIIDTFYITQVEDSNIDKEIYDIIDLLIVMIDEFIIDNPYILSCHDIDEIVIDYIYEYVELILDELKITNYPVFIDYNNYFENFDLIEISFELYDLYFNITHNHTNNDIYDDIHIDLSNNPSNYDINNSSKTEFQIDLSFETNSNDLIEEKINLLRSKPQPEQRTNEWYRYRHNLLTASNAYKALSSQSSINNLICEKCQPLKQINNSLETLKPTNINSPLHHGQKYEPLSVMIYEKKYNTKVEDFGCIKHELYDFIGASPDGINVDKNSHLYGRMLEIKNVVSRDITGIPKKEYWIQMQLQMEVCNLDYCDFLETKFVEYDNEIDYKNDNENIKGVILYFNTNASHPFYLYQPFDLNEQESELWINTNIENIENNENCENKMTWIKTIYWKLEKYSCILVERNRSWFQHNIEQLKNVWETILKERIEGHEHRLPKKRKPNILSNSQTNFEKKVSPTEGICLLSL